MFARKTGDDSLYYQFDALGNVVSVLRKNSTTTSPTVCFAYNAWGSRNYAYPSSAADLEQPFSYNGRWGYYYDARVNLYYCQHRFYSPDAGRWVNRDPIGFAGGMNVYGYCGSGPVGAVDSDGLEKELPKKGPNGTTYRPDYSQWPDPNLHIKHDEGETVISKDGGWRRPSGGHPRATPLPKKLRKPYRKIIRQFVKKASKIGGKIAPCLLIITAATEGPGEAMRDMVWADEVEDGVGKVTDWWTSALTNKTQEARSGLQGTRIDRWLGDDGYDGIY